MMKKIITYLNGLCIAGITGILVSCSSSVDQLTATAPEYQKLENLYVRLTNTEQSRNEAYYRQLKKEYYAALVPFWAGKTKMPVGGADFTDMLARKHGINLFYMQEGRKIPAYLIFMETIHDPTLRKTKGAQEIYEEQYGMARKLNQI